MDQRPLGLLRAGSHDLTPAALVYLLMPGHASPLCQNFVCRRGIRSGILLRETAAEVGEVGTEEKTMVGYRFPRSPVFLLSAPLLSFSLLLISSQRSVFSQDVAPANHDADSSGHVNVRASAVVFRQHRPNAWSVLSIEAQHIPGDSAAGLGGDGMIAVYFPGEPGRQFVRKLWVPEGGQRRAFLPFRMPQSVPTAQRTLNLQVASIDRTEDDRETFRRKKGGPLTDTILLSVDHDPVKTLAIYRRLEVDDQRRTHALDDDAISLLDISRDTVKLSTNISTYYEDFLPPWPEVFEQYQTMVLCGDRLAHDAAGIAAIRAWLRVGGRLWIMADRTPTSMLAAILGNRLDLTVVDRVELDRFAMESLIRQSGDVLVDECEFEKPVDFLRIATSRKDISTTIDGWPAAIWFPFGEGEVLLTTLAPRGWISEFDQQPTAALRQIMTRFFTVPEGRLDPAVMMPAVSQQIGYAIPSRGFAISVMAACCLCLAVVGSLLARRNQLHHLAWTVPLIVAVTTGVFVVTGLTNSHSVPPTISALEIHRTLPGTDEIRTEGLAAIYDSQSRGVDWSTSDRQWTVPVPPSDGDIHRLVWLDDDTVVPTDVSTAAGSVGAARLSAARVSTRPLSVTARFGPAGLEGTFSTSPNKPAPLATDAVILQASMPALPVAASADGVFTADADTVLPAGEYVARAVLSDRQAQRHAMLQQLLAADDSWVFPGEPSLLAWSDDLALASTFPANFAKVGSSLDVVPITLNPTPPRTRFTIPTTFLRPSIVPGRNGMSTAYNARTGQWVKGLTRGGETVLRFELPGEVRPCTLDGGTLTIRCNIPSRQLVVWAHGDPEPRSVDVRNSPSGVITMPLSSEHLALDAGGGVRIGIVVGDIETAGTPTTRRGDAQETHPSNFQDTGWQIDYVRLTVTGETSPVTEAP